MDKFEFLRGFDYININLGAPIGQYNANDQYFEKIVNEIEKLTKEINECGVRNNSIPQTAGFAAEYWHTGTFNISAAVQNIKQRATAPHSTDFASPDIKIGEWKVQSKFYKTPKDTAKALTKPWIEYYNSHKKGEETFSEFFEKRGLKVNEQGKFLGIYNGQLGLVPADQFEAIINELKRNIGTESTRRPHLVENLQKTLDNLIDRIKCEDGAESIPLTKEMAEELAKLAKADMFKPEDFGLSLDYLVSNQIIFKRALRAGTNAAMISAILNILPLIVSTIQNASFEEQFSWDDFAQKGLGLFTNSGKSFIIGALTAAINDMCKKKEINISDTTPEVIGSLIALIISIMGEFIKCSSGKITYTECMANCVRNSFVVSCGIAGSVIMHTIPIGIIIGNILGCAVGGFLYEVSNRIFLSYCAESGFSCFGLVEQDYELPDNVLKDMGLDICDIDTCELDICELDTCDLDVCEFDMCELDNAMPYEIKRGIIGINRIGYLIT